MLTPRDILIGFAVPLVAAIVVIVPLRRRAWAGGLAATLAYVLGHGLLMGADAWQPIEAYNWLLYGMLGAGFVGSVGALGRVPGWLVWPGRALVCGGLMYLTLKPLVPHALSPAAAGAWGGSLTLLMLAMWSESTRLAHAFGGATLPGVWLIAIGAAALAVGFTGSQKMMQLGGVMVAGLLPLVAVAARRCDREPGRSAAGPIVVLLVGLLANARFYSELPDWAAVVIVLLPMAALVRTLPFMQRVRPAFATLITFGLAVAPAVAVVLPLLRRFIEALNDPYNTYG